MNWYRIESKSDKAEIWIYESIGEDWWTGGGVTAKGFQKELSSVKASQIDLHINSPGGQVFDGITIYNLIKQHPATVTTYIDGLAASIASVIALAGDRIIMAENALYMIHTPSGAVMGTATDMRSFADVLDKIAGTMVTAYASKSGQDESEIIALLDAETWMTATEARDFGFVDEISDEMDMAACSRFIPTMSKMGFKNIPEIIKGEVKPTIRNLERVLREAGCSLKTAKAILAKGYSDGSRDDDPEEPAPIVQESLRDDEIPPAPRRIADRHLKLKTNLEG
jgi:ATP-dependent Clp protease protease subunit